MINNILFIIPTAVMLVWSKFTMIIIILVSFFRYLGVGLILTILTYLGVKCDAGTASCSTPDHNVNNIFSNSW